MSNESREAAASLRAAVLAGLVIAVVGLIVAGAAWPSTDMFGDKTGSAGGAMIGLAVTWSGSMLLLVGVIGYGVKLGREASPLVDASLPGD
jgi:hypothetical protein